MTLLAANITILFSIGVVILNIATVFLLLLLFFPKNSLTSSISRSALLISSIITLLGFIGSLLYSNVIGFVPCELCWWARILLYPQVVIFAVALYYKSKQATKTALITGFILSVIGAGLTLYHYYGQSFNPDVLPACAATGVSCAKLYFVSFGYITLPFMAFSTFAVLISIFLVWKVSEKNSK